MSRPILKLKRFLDSNKIFFEIIVSISLTFTSIYVSIIANQIALSQTRIMELENTPKLEIRKNQIYNDSLEIFEITEWYIFNQNSKIANVSLEKEVSFLNVIKRGTYQEFNIPCRNYLNSQGILTGSSEGLVYQFDNKLTALNEYQTREQFWDKGHLQLNTYISVSYDDVLNEKNEKFYMITPTIKEISKSTWDSCIRTWSIGSEYAVYLSENITENLQSIDKAIASDHFLVSK